MWLHEGFGSYMQALYAERLGGAELYRAYLAADRRYIVNRSPVAPRESRTAGEIYFGSGSDIYGKGSWVLHTLRWLIGEDAFFRSLRRMAYPDPDLERVTDGAHVRFATTDDFVRIAEEVSGQRLDWFFDVYVRQPHLPRLVLERGSGTLRVGWDVPHGLAFPMPVEIGIEGRRERFEVPERGSIEIAIPEGATVTPDPDHWILRSP
jgi:aminopeptidase N